MKKILISSLKIGVLLLLLVLISGCVSSDKSSTTAPNSNAVDNQVAQTEDIPAEGRQVEAPDPSRGIFNYVTWEYYVTDKINEYTEADPGSHFYVVTVHYNNTGTETYSTNSYNWELTADGVTYPTDASTYSMDYKLADVGPGGKTDVQYVFLVDGEPANITLNYEQW